MIMRGGFWMGAIVGAAATTYLLMRKNRLDNMIRMGKMITNAISEGFKMAAFRSGQQTAVSAQGSAASSSVTSGERKDKQEYKSEKESRELIEQLIAKNTEVQKEVNEIMSQAKH